MIYLDFFKKWNGRYLDYDGRYGYQCVDLMRAYEKEVCIVNPYTAIPTTGSAKNIFNNFTSNGYFTKILNSPTNIPQRGDILFFKTSYWFPFLFGIDGHVGIVDSADLYNIILFNQNYPTYERCRLTRFKYKDCLGWLRPRE